jgi:hypothetical protein
MSVIDPDPSQLTVPPWKDDVIKLDDPRPDAY